jgi:putative thioredoxin
MSDSPHVLEATAETFEAAVIEQSRRTPIVLDFWAAWCQPCRRLGPLLENLAQEYAGQFVLVKADVDQLPQQAAAFRVDWIRSSDCSPRVSFVSGCGASCPAKRPG